MIKKNYLLINLEKNKMQENMLIKEQTKNIMINKKNTKKNTSQILKIKNIKKNKCPINVKILSKTNKKKINKKNIIQIL